MKRIILSILLTAGLLAGCGGSSHPVAYRPIAYGENNQCYYVNDPVEAVSLQAAGLCQRSWVPTIMPLYFHQRYYPYYSSPAYYNTYVPVASRSSYTRSERTWGAANKGAIAAQAKTATYRGSNGKTVTASKIGATKYGSGNRFGPTGTKFGGGSGRSTNPTVKVNTPSKPVTAPKVSKPPSVRKSNSYPHHSSGGSKSYGGGSRSSGGFGGGGGRRR